MRRGELWIGASSSDYGGKPRPVLIVQSDHVLAFNSIVACPLTSIDAHASELRFRLEAGDRTGLRQQSWIMLEKVTAYDRNRLSRRIGSLKIQEMEMIDATLLELLGLRR